jgi:hypothetical protein
MREFWGRVEMRSVIAAAALALMALAAPVAAIEDARISVDAPPEVKARFLARMRTHMNTLNDVIQLMAAGKVREAGAHARKELAVGKALGVEQEMPPVFSVVLLDLHRAAEEFASIAEGPEPPDAAGWAKLTNALAKITTQCNACHAAFRIR